MSNGPKVYSKRKGATPPPSDAVYVGRPTVYGNPFVVGVDGNQTDCVQLYREWIISPEQVGLRSLIKDELNGKDLVCWCAPEPCHADIILDIANELVMA